MLQYFSCISWGPFRLDVSGTLGVLGQRFQVSGSLVLARDGVGSMVVAVEILRFDRLLEESILTIPFSILLSVPKSRTHE